MSTGVLAKSKTPVWEDVTDNTIGMRLYIAPHIWGGGTIANILPGGNVCQQMAKYQLPSTI